MTQGERTATIKALLKWLNEQKDGVTVGKVLWQIEVEITEMGATHRTAKGYLDSIRNASLVSVSGYRFKISEVGKKWLEAHQ